MKFNGILCIVCSIICAVFIGNSDAAVSAWTNPSISGASGNGAATPTVAEDTSVGSISVTIDATVVGTAAYAISSQPTMGKLTIDSGTGVLSLATGSFDFETEPTYTLVITCTDDNDDTVGTATVTISITNVNEAPAFAQAEYGVIVADAATEGTAVTTLTATDVDAGDTLAYSITAGNTPVVFAIDSATGKITVATGVTLDQATDGGYTLTITATDGDSLTDTADLWIAVGACNNGIKTVGSGLLLLVSGLAVLL